jgi:hypothetical protein
MPFGPADNFRKQSFHVGLYEHRAQDVARALVPL